MNISIGELSRRTDVKMTTIRYYESAGLVPEPARTEGKQGRYGQEEIGRLNFIRHARGLGFEIEVIRELLVLSDEPQQPCAAVDAIAIAHLRDIDSKISRLKLLRAEVKRMLGDCSHKQIRECRVIEVLASHECQTEHMAVFGAGAKKAHEPPLKKSGRDRR